MVIAGMELNGAQIGQHHRGVIGIGGNHVLGHPAVAVQEPRARADQLQKRVRRFLDDVHSGSRRILFLTAAQGNLAENLIMDGVNGITLFGMNKRQRLTAVVRENLLHRKRC